MAEQQEAMKEEMEAITWTLQQVSPRAKISTVPSLLLQRMHPEPC